MISEVFICNLALINVAKSEITSLDEASAEAAACRRFYAHVRNIMLESYPYLFARRIVALAEVANDRPLRWTFAYRLPADLRKVLLVHDETIGLGDFSDAEAVGRGGHPYDLAGTTLYCDVPAARLEHTFTQTDPTKFTALFVEAFGWELAVRIAMPLTRDPKLRADAYQLAMKASIAAQVHDANSTRDTTHVPVPALQARQ